MKRFIIVAYDGLLYNGVRAPMISGTISIRWSEDQAMVIKEHDLETAKDTIKQFGNNITHEIKEILL